MSSVRTALARFEELWLPDRARLYTQAEITERALERAAKQDVKKKANQDKKQSQQLSSLDP